MLGLVNYEIERLKYRNFWLIPGALFFSFYIFILPIPMYFIFHWLKSNFSQIHVCVMGIIISHHITFITHSLVFYLITKLSLPFLEKYRVDNKWPYHLFKKAMQTLSWNFLIAIPIVEYFFAYVGMMQVRQNDEIPPYTEIFWQIVFCMITEEIWTYTFHRLLHTPMLYKYHKKHHEYTASIGYSAEYAHIVEFIFVNIMATGSGSMLLGNKMHSITFMLWISYRIGDTIDLHSGYDFPWIPYSVFPFATTATYHDIHHTSNNGNYSSQFVILDYLLGTESIKNKNVKGKNN
ncbi:hypothetical protein SteCoe_32011 [Stentor coeruleus]|uniref:Fatty acid hydroxylase domain-containing protein n=1 Tax=Stentor coeruleus TaxID=5963 RepID=A0A1R2AZX8_9CILI|nr:hypothetical protein SteCoe_32011 [Stentor coeruleus]